MQKGFSIPAIALAFALCSAPALAGSVNAVLNGKSYHLNSSYDWNEDNTGVGIEYEFTRKTDSAWKRVVMANGFRDSTDGMSYMAGFGLHRRLYETDSLSGFHVYAGLNAFLMTREDVNGNKPFPGVLPSLTVGNDRFGLNLTYLPRRAVEEATNSRMLDPTIDGIVFLQLKVSLDQLLP